MSDNTGAFATVQELAAGWRPLTAGEELVAGELLARAAVRLRCYVEVDAGNALQAALLKQFSCNMVRRALEPDAFGIPPETTGATVWAPENPARDMWLSKAELKELRLASASSHAGMICAMGPVGHEG